MIFYDVTLMVGQNSTLEYDSSGTVIEKQLSLNNMSINIAEDKIGKFTIVKDPVINHVNIYAIEMFNLPLEIINMFKANLITAIIIRLGNSIVDGQKNFNLFKIFIKPITIYEHAVNEDKILNDLVVKGISLTTNAILLDSAFGAEIELVDTTVVSSTVSTPKSKVKSNFKNYIAMDASETLFKNPYDPYNSSSGTINRRAANPGNLKWWPSQEYWPGQNGFIKVWNKITNDWDRFAVFDSFENGVAAGLANLKNYITPTSLGGRGKVTVLDIVKTWAPKDDGNNPEAYAAKVESMAGIAPNQRVTEADLLNLFKAMAIYEGDNVGSKRIYSDEILTRGAQIAKINTQLSNGFNYGSGKLKSNHYNSAGTNVNKLINSFSNTQGFTLLSTFLQKMKEKYSIEIDSRSLANLIKSNFMYKNISFPAVTTLELLKKIHKDYPPYMANIPWILDDAKPTQDINKIGKTIYTEINILSIDSLDFRSMKNIYNNSALSLTLLSKDNFRQFYNETLDRVESKHIIFKDLTTQQETSFPGKSTNQSAIIPAPEASSTGAEGVKQIKINSGETLNIEAIYDATEFKKRYDLFINHLKTNPQLVKCIIQTDNPEFIDFGYSYTFADYDLNKVTPYKIKMEFRNVNNKFRLKYEVDFYKGIGIVQA